MRIDHRAGKFIIKEGIRHFVPNMLPPNDPPVAYEGVDNALFEETSHALGGLDTVVDLIPNIDLFVAAYVKKEAILSCQIEGSKATLKTLYDKTAEARDIRDVVACIEALNSAFSLCEDDPTSISETTIKQLHHIMMEHTDDSHIGKYRDSHVFIGGIDAKTASYNPPPHTEVKKLMKNLASFINNNKSFSPLTIAAIAHAQFEMIHPFFDGNGRMGRLLIPVVLLNYGVLKKPILYPSYYFKLHHDEYYAALSSVDRKGKWELWLNYFFRALLESTKDAITRAKAINKMREEHIHLLSNTTGVKAANALKLLDHLYRNPVVSAQDVLDCTGLSGYQHAQNLIKQFMKLQLLDKTDPNKKWGVEYIFTPYIDVLESV